MQAALGPRGWRYLQSFWLPLFFARLGGGSICHVCRIFFSCSWKCCAQRTHRPVHKKKTLTGPLTMTDQQILWNLYKHTGLFYFAVQQLFLGPLGGVNDSPSAKELPVSRSPKK